jgi:flagellar motility protein MotE (MotC chaperone)
MTLEEALKKIEDLEAELKRVNEHREELRRIAKRNIGANNRYRYYFSRESEKHDRATQIIADMGGY